MAFRRTLAHRFLSLAKIRPAPSPRRIPPASGEDPWILRRILQRRPLFQSADLPTIPASDRLIERLGGLGGGRGWFEGMTAGITAEEVRKVLRASQMEAARSRLRATARSCMPYSEFLQVCCEVSSQEQGTGIAKSLDESGTVVVMGNVVFLRPDQIAKAIQDAIPGSLSLPIDHQAINELKEMEVKKLEIDQKAVALVRRELWCGLGFVAAQTAGFMRLTFWELSWDVMEPICFFVTSGYFMTGYAFFLRTAREPSFEGFFESRFAAKQKRLMRAQGFDIERFNALRRACGSMGVAAAGRDCGNRKALSGAGHYS